MEGSFQQNESGIYCEKGQVVEDLKCFFGINFDAISAIKIDKKARLDVLNLLLNYYQLFHHLL